MKKIILQICFFTLISFLFSSQLFGHSHRQSDFFYSSIYHWELINLDDEIADSTWTISDKIEFTLTPTSEFFLFCPPVNLFVIQGGNEFGVSIDPSEVDDDNAFINCFGCCDPDNPVCCDEVEEGMEVSAEIDNFPGWFEIGDFFQICYERDNNCLNVNDTTLTPTTSSTITPTPIPITTSTINHTTTTGSFTTTTITPSPSTISTTTTTAIETTSSIASTSTISITTTTAPSNCLVEQLYGEQSEETLLLRYLRDNSLSKTQEGQELTRLYYHWSPLIVKAMEEDEKFKEEMTTIIDGILPLGSIKF